MRCQLHAGLCEEEEEEDTTVAVSDTILQSNECRFDLK